MKKKLSMIIVVLALGAFAGIAVAQVPGIAGPPSGDGVQPVWYDDNPQAPAPDGGNSNCAYFNPSWFELRVPSATDGTYTKGGLSVDVTFYDGTLGIYTGQLMDWSSNIGVDAVFVKAGDEGNLYTYIPEDNGDTQLHGPVNPNNNQFIGVSHVSFCFDYEVTVTKTANTTFTRTFNWTIDKSVTPDTWDLFTGDSGTSEYTVAVTKDAGTDSDWAVSGTITIQNNTPLAATITDVSDAISGFGAVAVNCGVTFPHVLSSGATLTCSYSTPLADGSNRTNTATVTTSGTVGGGSASFPVTFGNPTTVVNDSITVTDTNSAFGGPYTVSGNMTWTYNRPFTCDADQGTHNNTATIVQTSQFDSASVTVNCYALQVRKNANTSFTRTYHWDITKEADASYNLFSGDTRDHKFTVSVDKTGFTDSNWAVSGVIGIRNPAPIAATINSVSDVISKAGDPDIAASVDCAVSFPYQLAANSSLTCTYSADLPNADTRTNTAKAKLQNYDYDSEGNATESGTTDFSGTASVDFANATITEVNDSVTVTDTNEAFGGPKTVSDDTTFPSYEVEFACDADEGSHTNTAKVIGDGGVELDSDTATVTIVCWDLTVTKDAQTSLTRTFDWDITKEADATYNLFSGDTQDHTYTVSVNKDAGTDSNWAVSGSIAVYNPAPMAATIHGVADVVSPAIAASVSCGVSFPHTLASLGTLNCTYSASLPDAATRTNTATATLQNYDYDSEGVGTASGTTDFTGPASVNFANATITKVNDSVSVTDTNVAFGGPKTASDDASWAYEVEFACDADDGPHTNTAKVIGDGDVELDSDTATVTIVCWDLTVTKDASTSFTRTWNWTIDKSADQTDLLLSEGQLFQVNYEVTVNATFTDSDHAVSGNISVNNPAPIDATLNGVSDVVSPNTAANVDCSVTFPYTLAAGGTLPCTYSANLPDASDRTNTATATLQNYDYDSDGNGTPSGTTGFSFSANVSFANATITEVDECIDVSDTNDGVLGTVCAGDAPKTFTYSLWFGAPPDADVVLECGDNTHTNTASFVTNDTSATGSDSWTVNANVACAEGCTLTPGYWKTHSKYGPAPFDDLWATNGQFNEDTPFFLSGKTYYEVLWTSPQGNAYYILAHAYIAAKLNILNGASSTPEVNAAITYAETFFSSHAPSDKLSKSERNAAIVNAFTLDSYNNGLSGPGHCSE